MLPTGFFQLALKIALTFIIILAMGCLCGLLVVQIQRRFKRKVHREFSITLKNLGNVTSMFHLTAESLEPLLSFRILQNNIPLPEIIETIEAPQAIMTEQASHEPQNPHVTDDTSDKNKVMAAKISKQPPVAVKSSKEAADKVIAKTGALSGLLGVVGGLLPGSLGKSIKEKGAAVRDVQTKAKDASEKPNEMQRKLGEVQKNSGKLGVKTPPPQIQSFDQSKSTGSNQAGINQTSPVQQAPRAVAISHSTKISTYRYACTNEVEPGESLLLTLSIASKKRQIPGGSSLYTLKSQQIPVGSFDKEIPLVSKQGVVNFAPIGKWHYWYSNILSALLIAASTLLIIYFVSLLWG